MKFRMSFVTNSSSSSYVIAYKNIPEIDKETIDKYPFLKNYNSMIEKVLFTASDRTDTNAGKKITTINELDEYLVNEWGWKDCNTIEKILADDTYLKENYDEYIKSMEKGYCLLFKRVDHSDDYFDGLINNLTYDNDDFIILEGE